MTNVEGLSAFGSHSESNSGAGSNRVSLGPTSDRLILSLQPRFERGSLPLGSERHGLVLGVPASF